MDRRRVGVYTVDMKNRLIGATGATNILLAIYAADRRQVFASLVLFAVGWVCLASRKKASP